MTAPATNKEQSAQVKLKVTEPNVIGNAEDFVDRFAKMPAFNFG